MTASARLDWCENCASIWDAGWWLQQRPINAPAGVGVDRGLLDAAASE